VRAHRAAAALPSILTGLRLGLGYSGAPSSGAELIAAASGLGYLIHDAEALSRPDVIVGGGAGVGVIGAATDHLSSALRPGHPLAPPGGCSGWMD
jgi:sulfonate transport system permease protein